MKILNFFVASFFAFGVLLLIGCGSDDSAVDCLRSGPGVVVSQSVDPTCIVGGALTASSTGGVAPVVYSINGVDFQESATFTDLDAGLYTITARDANGCSSSTSVTLTLQSDITLSLLATEAGCGGSTGTLTIEAGGGSGDYTYSIDGGSFQSQGVFNNLTNGAHEVTVKDGDCLTSAEAVVPSGISFEEEISPIITSNCALAECHGGTQAPNFTSLATIQEFATQIMQRTAAKTMPPAAADQLTDAQIQAIACWVTDGAKDN